MMFEFQGLGPINTSVIISLGNLLDLPLKFFHHANPLDLIISITWSSNYRYTSGQGLKLLSY
jgi:hypothetical protein